MEHIKINRIILTLYLLLVCVSSVYLYVTHDKLWLVFIIAVLTVLLYFISGILLTWFHKITFKQLTELQVCKQGIVFVACVGVCFAVLMLWFMAFRPGSYEEDNIAQLGQALSGRYDSWHPIWHTLVFFTLPYKLTGSINSVVIFQIFCFSLALGYVCMVLYRYTGPVYSAIVFAYIVLNPFICSLIMYPFKDVAFAICCMVATALAAEMYFERDKLRASYIKSALLGFILANATLFRYNGVIYTAALLVVMLFYIDKRKWLVAAGIFALTMMIVQGPVYGSLDAAVSETETVQVVGFPMSIIGNAVKETPDILDEDILEFAYRYAPKEVWEERYARGNFNLMKYGGAYDPDVIEETGAWNIVKMAGRCFFISPQASFDAVFALTDFVYGLDIRDKADIDIMNHTIIDNDHGVVYEGNVFLASALDAYYRVIRLNGVNFIRKIGFSLLLVIIAALSRINFRSAGSFKPILICLPVLAYDFGTMLLLSGHDARFFFMSFMVCPIVIGVILGRSCDAKTGRA